MESNPINDECHRAVTVQPSREQVVKGKLYGDLRGVWDTKANKMLHNPTGDPANSSG